jgi:hypothetical protein
LLRLLLFASRRNGSVPSVLFPNIP